MKKTVFLLISLIIGFSVHSQDITGQWNGMLKVQGIQLRIVVNINQTENGYTASMDSPDQGAKGIPASSVGFENPTLKFEISNLRIQYEGTLDEKNQFVGIFNQAGMSIPLILTREELKKEELNRPQEPVEPYPYYSEDIVFENVTDSIKLAGTLTLPQKEGIFPAVILISGSGPQNRNEELLGHKPFLVLADHLTKNGIAVLRFDDRGSFESEGDFKTATSLNFAQDVEAALLYLQTRKEIDKKKIGLIGHSEGGIIAPMVAAKNKNIRFIVLLAGTGIPGYQLLLLQQELIARANGINETDIQKTKAINQGAFKLILDAENNDTLKSDLSAYIKQSMKDLPSSDIPSEEDDFISLQVNQLTSPWMLFFLRYDPFPTLEKVKCPVLAINGSKDLQVPAKVNLDAINLALKNGKNKQVLTREFSNLNHLFQECETGSPAEYAKIEQTISPLVLTEISNWILKITK